MNITLITQEIQKHLNAHNTIPESKHLPDSQNILLTINTNSITLTSISDDIQLSTTINTQTQQDHQQTISINKKLLQQLLNTQQQQNITLTINNQTITPNDNSFSLQYEINPTAPTIQQPQTIITTLNPQHLSEIIQKTIPFINNDNLRPALLNATYLILNPNTITPLASNAIIAIAPNTNTHIIHDIQTIPQLTIPTQKTNNTTSQIINTLQPQQLSLSQTQTHFILSDNTTTIATNKPEKQLPNILSLIQPLLQTQTTITTQKQQILNSCKLLSITSTPYTPTTITHSQNNITISNNNTLAKTQSIINTTPHTQFQTIGLNINNLITSTKPLNDTIHITISQPNKPILLTDNNLTTIIMPMQLN